MKHHVLDHFKEKLLAKLPTRGPFTCPECSSNCRDRREILRHYAFVHKKIYEIAAEEDFESRPPGHPMRLTKSVPSLESHRAMLMDWASLPSGVQITGTCESLTDNNPPLPKS